MATQIASGESAQMYLKAIGELTLEDPLVPISALAERLGISAVSATEMVHRLGDQGFLEHERYKGVRLTHEGKRRAMLVLRRHRLWERFLADTLELPWDEVHDLACSLEHAVGDTVSDALDSMLAQPKVCPHGNPIPNHAGEFEVINGVALDHLRGGDEGVILRIRPESKDVLSYVVRKGIKPGVRIRVIAWDEIDGLWTLSVEGKEQSLGQQIASHIVIKV